MLPNEFDAEELNQQLLVVQMELLHHRRAVQGRNASFTRHLLLLRAASMKDILRACEPAKQRCVRVWRAHCGASQSRYLHLLEEDALRSPHSKQELVCRVLAD